MSISQMSLRARRKVKFSLLNLSYHYMQSGKSVRLITWSHFNQHNLSAMYLGVNILPNRLFTFQVHPFGRHP